MADLMTALRNADAAGDTEAATRIAKMIKEQNQPVEQPKIEQPKEPVSFLDRIIGGTESAASIVSGIVAEPIAGIVGLADAANPFGAEGAGGERVKQVREALTYQPKSEYGIAEQQAVGEALAPVGEAISGFEESVGAGALHLTGSPTLAAMAQALPAATAEILTLGAMTPIVTTTKQLTRQGKELAKQSATKTKIAELINKGSTDKDVAKFKLKESMMTGKVKAVKDKVAIESIKQGFDEGVVAAIKGSSKVDKAKMLEMVDIMEKGKGNTLFSLKNRPSDIAGDSLMNRFKAVKDANKAAGTQLEKIAKKLSGKKVDNKEIINNFSSDLESMGVTFDEKGIPIFKGSDIEGLSAPTKAIKQMIGRLKSVKSSDAYKLHQMKRFIDENVTYGKAGEGLKGQAERLLKKLRSDIDGVLDNNFPEYDKVNTKYADTITAIDSLQDVAGRKMNLTGVNSDKATGTLLRRLMSNATSRVRLLDAVDDIESTAIKYGSKFDDDLLSQVLFVDELDSVFKPVARTSFSGQISQVIPTSKADAAVRLADAAAKKIRGVSEKGAFKTIKELLSDGG